MRAYCNTELSADFLFVAESTEVWSY